MDGGSSRYLESARADFGFNRDSRFDLGDSSALCSQRGNRMGTGQELPADTRVLATWLIRPELSGKTDGKHDRGFDKNQLFFDPVERNESTCLIYGEN